MMSSKVQFHNVFGLIALAGMVIAPIATPVQADQIKKPAPAKLICPVTGSTIDSVADAAGSSVYKGKKYYFCCSGCKPQFDKDPSKFVKPTASK